MAFTEVTNVWCRRVGRDLAIEWTATAGNFQVYLDGRLAWFGTARRALFPWPLWSIRIVVGTVGADEAAVDYSGSLPADPMPSNRVTLTWKGGTYQGANLAGYRVYHSATPGGAVDYSTLRGWVPLNVGPGGLSGWGIGGWNTGQWGYAAANYSWSSSRLTTGNWSFAVVPVDVAGNEQATPSSATVAVTAAPMPPAPDSAGIRLRYTYNPTTRVPTLTWTASPSAGGGGGVEGPDDPGGETPP
jgi:hypothetical protein